MAVSSVADLVRDSSNSLKSILTSQDLGSEYQLMCTELSLQLLRIRLWAESVGIHIDEPGRGEHGIFDRPDVKKPITRAVNSIALLLTEIDILRRNYDLKPTRQVSTGLARNSSKFLQTHKSRNSITAAASSSSSSSSPEFQRQRSFLGRAKWAMSDSKKFQEKVRKLKGLIDSLEDVSKSVALGRPPQTRSQNQSRESSGQNALPHRVRTSSLENPPPYSSPRSTRRRQNRATQAVTERQMSISRSSDSTQGSDGQRETVVFTANRPPSELPADTGLIRSSSAPLLISDVLFAKHFTALKTYLSEVPAYAPRPSREKLFALSEAQLQEMRTDLYDELVRRQQGDAGHEHLLDDPKFRPKRNHARQRLAILRPHRFGHLVSDLVCEIERRSLDDCEKTNEAINEVSPTQNSIRRSQSEGHHRVTSTLTPTVGPTWDSSDEGTLPPTPVIARMPALTIPTINEPIPEEPTSEDPESNNKNPSNRFIKSFHVGIHSPTSDILPVAMARYGIQGRWQQYSLYIRLSDEDRCLGLEEKPLMVFKKLQKQGKKPVFMLKKRDAKAPAVVEVGEVQEIETEAVPDI